MEEWATGGCSQCTLRKIWCTEITGNGTTFVEAITAASYAPISGWNGSDIDANKCKYLFNLFDLSDAAIGVILLITSLVVLYCALFAMVKLLKSLLMGKLKMKRESCAIT